MIGLCYYFGGQDDLLQAERLEQLLKDAGKEIPEEFERECLRVAANEGDCDYLGSLYDLTVGFISNDLEEEIGDYISNKEVESYPNYIASSGTITVEIDEEMTETKEDLRTLLDGLVEISNRYEQILREFRIDIIFRFEESEYDLAEFISFLRNHLTTLEE